MTLKLFEAICEYEFHSLPNKKVCDGKDQGQAAPSLPSLA